MLADHVQNQVKRGALVKCDRAHSKLVFEHLRTVFLAGGLVRHEATLRVQQCVLDMAHARTDFKAIGKTYADIAGVANAESMFAVMHRALLVAEKGLAEETNSEAGVFPEMIDKEELASTRTALSEYSAVALENKDRYLLSQIDKIVEKCSLDASNFKATWHQGITSFEDFRKVALTTFMAKEKTDGLKQLLQEASEVPNYALRSSIKNKKNSPLEWDGVIHEVYKATLSMREIFKPDLAMPKEGIDSMFQQAEIYRSTAHMMNLFSKPITKAYPQGQLRTDLIAEIKSLRSKTRQKEQEVLPQFLYEQVQKVLWDR